MDVFALRDHLIGEYRSYVESFITIRDSRIRSLVEREIEQGLLWPDPLIQLNPNFEPGRRISELVAAGILHPECERIFRVGKQPNLAEGRDLLLHKHQDDAVQIATQCPDANYVLTTGTGSGKSLSYIIPIVDYCLRHRPGDGTIKAIIIYPMNALANSQKNELEKFINYGYPNLRGPLRFERYTGQEDDEVRRAILACPPDILLTNFVMAELMLTRPEEQQLIKAARNLRFLVLDELHTYRGRQGSDVAMLVRRIRSTLSSPDFHQRMRCIGTSATLATADTFAEQQRAVAEVATALFGERVRPEHVIGETLRRITREYDFSDPEVRARLRQRVLDQTPPTDHGAFCEDPLASWIETTFGLQREAGSQRLKRATPLSILGEQGGAGRLAAVTNCQLNDCERAIKKMLMAGYLIKNPQNDFPLFAFRLHQFISRADTVHATLETVDRRYLTVRAQHLAPGEPPGRLLFPLCFCRECGQEFYRVFAHRDQISKQIIAFSARVNDDLQQDVAGEKCYLFIDTAEPWPEDEQKFVERLPEDWLETAQDGCDRVKENCRAWVPKAMSVAPDGTVSPNGLRVHYLAAPFRFCPNCGITYDARQRSEIFKLATLSIDSRSTATTILTVSAVQYLQSLDPKALPAEARKLLSFTDNRQDASLQAGHFNDFVQIGLLRGAIYKAAADAGPAGLRHEELVQRVFQALALDFADYAANPEARHAGREPTERALRQLLGYLVYRDLRRGWRVIAPNLEQCGLLVFDYAGLGELAHDGRAWQEINGEPVHPALAQAKPEVRSAVVRTLLDYLRRSLAIKVEYLEADFHERLRQLSDQHLRPPWAIDDDRPSFERSVIAYAGAPSSQPANRYADRLADALIVSERGAFGTYLMRKQTFPDYAEQRKLDRREAGEIIRQLFAILRTADLLHEVCSSDSDKGQSGYQLPAASLIWKAGDGQAAFHDILRVPTASRSGRRTNPYFVRFYRERALQLRRLEAREHTAQVPDEVRIEREQRFGSALLPVLFCSPTMELGVDIRQLNVVNMRNVPPTPANYAQRSGRAGRSGQPALVFTYCSGFSQHDQWFFRRPERMVSGSVSVPRLDLGNEDLVRAHVHAIWLAETGAALGKSLCDVLEVAGDSPTLQIRPELRAALESVIARQGAKAKAMRLVSTLGLDDPRNREINEAWIDMVLQQALRSFDLACERWRSMYRAANEQRRLQNAIIGDASRSKQDKDNARRLRNEAENQLALLTDTKSLLHSDFYSYRYFASEGFLPGYNFPRLPLSAYLPGRRQQKGRDEFLSRPRFIAISEFGPGSLIYHEGCRYRIHRVIMPVREGDDQRQALSVAKLCSNCGYLHPVQQPPGPDLCERCQTPLHETLDNLFRLENVATRRRDRITCDEEERLRFGYEISAGLRFADIDGRPNCRRALATSDGRPLLELEYGHAATLWRINRGWVRRDRSADGDGFYLDMESGYWVKAPRSEDDNGSDERKVAAPQQVIPFVEDRRNALLLVPRAEEPRRLDRAFMASLQAALKHAIQVCYQLEDNELAAEPLPDAADRRLLLLYESAEGGAGVLRHLVDDPSALARVAQQALELCHFDPESGEDRRRAPRATEDCAAACYDCLLSYSNQRDHRFIDRHLIRDFLRELTQASVAASSTERQRAEQLERLRRLCQSELERTWLDLVDSLRLRLPTDAQRLIPDCCTRPDFIYELPGTFVAVYIDGPPHDFPDRAQRDQAATALLEERGWLVLRFHHRDGWMPKLAEYPSVFGRLTKGNG
ncbi:MAG: DEAD/DEAH box helicase [Planctomycetota bacterium]|nr:DEAD/DEAH box helicase [Planctomycetota bacterium]